MSFLLFRFVEEKVSLERMVSFQFAGAGNAETFSSGFLVFNLGILFPFNKLELNNKLSGMPIRPNNSDKKLYTANKF